MVPINYSYRNLLVRWRTTLMTASGFTLVVTALIIMLAFVNGVRKVSVVTGEPENIIILKEGNTDEIISELDHETAMQVESTPGIVRGESGRLLVSRELFMVLTPSEESGQGSYLLQTRGVQPVAFEVHSHIRISQGRMFRRFQREVIVGAGVARELEVRVGDTIPVGRSEWDVVGIFESGGSTFESEVWCDLNSLANYFHRKGIYSSILVRTVSPQAAREAADYLKESRLVDVEAMPEVDYYQAQAEQTTTILAGAIVIAIFMGIGAVLGVTNTMFAAIGQRTKDIAVLRLLGYGRIEILLSFLFEALLIALIGGTLGSAIGYAINGLTLSTAMGAKMVAFAFTVDAATLIAGAAFTFVMGFIGGLLPALSAMQVKPLEALR